MHTYSIIVYITKPHEFNVKKVWNCLTPAYVSLKYCEKSVKTSAVNLGHLTSSNIFFFYKSCYKRYLDQHYVLIFCICIARDNQPTTIGSSPHNDKICNPSLSQLPSSESSSFHSSISCAVFCTIPPPFPKIGISMYF